jgi:Zn-dependent M28 family amino/carboxypeptidase
MKTVLLVAMIACLPASVAPALAVAAGAEFDARAIRAHVRFLSDDLLEGRAAGSRGYDIAAAYVAAWFERVRLEPAGDDGSFLQTFPTVEGRLVDGSAIVSITAGDVTDILESRRDYMIGGSYVDPATDLTAPVTFVGFGIRAPEMGYDDLTGLELSGHVVLMFDGAPDSFPPDIRAYYSSGEVKFRGLSDLGVAGVIVIRTRAMARKYSWDDTVRSYAFPGMRWLRPDGQVKGVYPGLKFALSMSPAGLDRLLAGGPVSPEALYDQAERGVTGGRPLERTIRVQRRATQTTGTTSNVAAILRGADPDRRAQYVVITAHLDHIGTGPPTAGDGIYNGAYDNATGVAVMLEVARALSRAESRPARSILFLAVGGEEKGLLGSDYFAEFPTVPMEAVVANVNLDMPLFLYPLADVVAFGAEHSSLDAHVAEAAARAGLTVSPDPMPEEVLFIRSDQYPFVKKGVPAVFFVPGFRSSDPDVDAGRIFTEFLQKHYHKPTDDMALPFHDDSAVAFTLANYHLIRSIAESPEAPTWNDGDFFGEKFGKSAPTKATR